MLTDGDVPGWIIKISINNSPGYFCLLYVAQKN